MGVWYFHLCGGKEARILNTPIIFHAYNRVQSQDSLPRECAALHPILKQNPVSLFLWQLFFYPTSERCSSSWKRAQIEYAPAFNPHFNSPQCFCSQKLEHETLNGHLVCHLCFCLSVSAALAKISSTRPEPQVDLQKHPARHTHTHMQSTQAYIYHYYSQNVQTNILYTQQVRTRINNECDRSNREWVSEWVRVCECLSWCQFEWYESSYMVCGTQRPQQICQNIYTLWENHKTLT